MTQLLETLSKDPESVITVLNNIRDRITHPLNLALHFAGNLDILEPVAVNVINDFLPYELKELAKQNK